MFVGDIKDNTEKFDYGLAFGGGVSVPVNRFLFFIEAKYTLGMRDLMKGGDIQASAGPVTLMGHIDEEDQMKTRNLQLMAGASIAL